jgi:cytochrome c1
MTLSHGLALALVACLAVACGEGEPAEPSSVASQAASPAPALTGQAAVGQKLFAEHCSGCHGGSVSVSSFAMAADLLDYVGTNMPRNAPGSLTQDEYLSIVAFDLTEKGIDLHGETLDAANAGSISLR